MTYQVEVMRTAYGFRTLEIKANNEQEAEQKALDTAGNFGNNILDESDSQGDDESSIPKRDHVRSLVCGMPSSERQRRRFCMLAGYYDDSADLNAFIVGGLVSPVPRWEGFSDDWQTALHQHPRIEYYKSYHANVRPEDRKSDNQFRGFSRGMIRKKEKNLAEVIVAHAEYSVYSPLNRDDFNAIILSRVQRPKRGIGRYQGHEYHYPFHGCIGATVKYLKENNIKDQVDFFFDEQGKVGKWARDMYEDMKTSTIDVTGVIEDIRAYLGVCVPHDDKKMVALQAADMFASRARKYDQHEDGDLIEDDPAFAILATLPCRVGLWPRERLRAMVDKWFLPPGDDST